MIDDKRKQELDTWMQELSKEDKPLTEDKYLELSRILDLGKDEQEHEQRSSERKRVSGGVSSHDGDANGNWDTDIWDSDW